MQRNKCTKVVRNTKQQYFHSLLRITDTKKFGKIVKPFFANKTKTANTVILHKNIRIIKDNKKISHTLNKKISPVLKKKSLKHLLRHF